MASSWSQDIYVKAWDFASVAHHGQTYGGPVDGQRIDYINHVGSVAMELLWVLGKCEGIDGNLALQCALLHDVIEDTQYTYEDIAAEFSEAVANGVLALTKNESLSTKLEQMEDSLARIKQQPKEVWMVKLADRITNLSQPPCYWKKEKRIQYQHEARLILQALGGANNLLASRLADRILSYQAFIDVEIP